MSDDKKFKSIGQLEKAQIRDGMMKPFVNTSPTSALPAPPSAKPTSSEPKKP